MTHHAPIHTATLHIDPPRPWRELYREVYSSGTQRPHLGTEIWWAEDHEGRDRCLKEFMGADLSTFGRELPDPSWGLAHGKPRGAQRGLAPRRAAIFDQMHHGDLKRELARFGPAAHPDFRSLFCVSAFELESLITQFARHYRCPQLVHATRWGTSRLETRKVAHPLIEMERLTPLTLPTPGDALSILDQLIAMMSAVCQLHSMQIPLRCYPPELTPDLSEIDPHSFVRPFHYDLSPDQFLLRPQEGHAPDQIVLIDFNASRVDQAEFSEFAWRSIPGKDYYQPPERRAHQLDQTLALSYRSHPVYDLYAMLVIGLFLFAREDERQQRIQQIDRWSDIKGFYHFLFGDDLQQQLKEWLPQRKGIDAAPLQALMQATFHQDPQQRIEQLHRLSMLRWQDQQDWMLLPRSMDMLARQSMGRSFSVSWRQETLTLSTKSPPQPLSALIRPEQCTWQPGRWEQGRINHPIFDPGQLFFFQANAPTPLLFQGSMQPLEPGTYTLYASFGGCVDFANPLYVHIEEADADSIRIAPAASDPGRPTSPSRLSHAGAAAESTDEFGSPVPASPTLDDLPSSETGTDQDIDVDAPSNFVFHSGQETSSSPPPSNQGNTRLTTNAFNDTLLDSQVSVEAYMMAQKALQEGPPDSSAAAHLSALADTPLSPSADIHQSSPANEPHSTPPGPAGTQFFRRETQPAPSWRADQAPHAPKEQASAAESTRPFIREAYEAGAWSAPAPEISPDDWGALPEIQDQAFADPPWVADLQRRRDSSPQLSSTPAPSVTSHQERAARAQRASKAIDELGAEAKIAPHTHHDPIGEWLQEIAACQDLTQLERDEQNAHKIEQPEAKTLLLLNLFSRRCQLLEQQDKLKAHTPQLRELAMLREHPMPAIHIEGLWLNNLVMLCCQIALREQRWPPWRGLLGFEPLSELKAWLRQNQSTTPPEASPRFWEIRDCVRDTLHLAQLLIKRVRK